MKSYSTRFAHLLLVLPSLTVFGACKGTDGAETRAEAPPMALGQQDVAVARLAEIGGAITISGPLEPYQVVNIRAQASGTVTGLRVDRGTSVRAGQVLAVIEAAGIRSQAAGARAGVAAARANLAVARQRLEAANTLKQAGAMSDIDYRVAVATYEASAAQLAAAQAQAATAGEAAANTAVVSPISGVISARTIQPGEAVAPGAPLLTVVNPSILELAGQAGVNQASRIQVGQPVIFEVDAFPGREFEGRVSRKDPTADPGTRQVGIYVRLPNADGRIVGGQFARGRIVTRSAQQVVVPQVAIRTVGNAPTVLVISNNRIQRRPVTLGDRDEATGTIGVLSGVQAGDVIVVASSDLPAGTRVTVAADAAAAVPRPGVPASSREP